MRRSRRAVGVQCLIRSRAKALIGLFTGRGLIPRTLKFFAALATSMPFAHV